MSSKKEIVVVTGSSGCLGQHIIKLLQEKDDNVGEIRLLDKVPYENKLRHSENKPMKHFIGDIRDLKTVLEVLSGADCVIHAACFIDISLFPNEKEMLSTNVDVCGILDMRGVEIISDEIQSPNVLCTKNIIEGCIKQSVPRLVFASTTDMVCGTEHIFYGTESTTPIPTSFMIGKYGETKCESEKLVVEASEKTLANGEGKLRTAAIRPTPFYGEQDKHFFYAVLKNTKKMGGYYRRVRSLDERLQICYVGNAAWAHIKAKDRLAVDETISGEAFFITDDTPIIDIHEHLTPYLEARGFKVSSYIFPYWLVWLFLSFLVMLINFMNRFVTFKVDIPSVSQLNYMCSTFFYNRSKATLRLDYQPIYTPEEARERSMSYYLKVPI